MLTKSWKHFVLAGVLPVLSALSLLYVFVRSAIDYWNPANSYTPAWFAFGDFQGVGPALVIGIGSLLIGIPLMLWWRAVNPSFFRRKAEVADSIDGLLADPDRITDEAELAPGPAPEVREPSRL